MVVYRSSDDVYYGTNAERLADTQVKAIATTKFYCYDTGKIWVSDGTTATAGATGWHEIGVAD